MVIKGGKKPEVRWLEGLDPAFEAARDTGKLVFLDVFHPG